MSPSDLPDETLLGAIATALAGNVTEVATNGVLARLEKLHNLLGRLTTMPDCAALLYSSPTTGEALWKAIGERLIVGRSSKLKANKAESVLQIADDELSRRHFEIVHQHDGIYSICDLESTNGLFIDGAEEKSCLLVSGAEIQAGRTSFIFLR